MVVLYLDVTLALKHSLPTSCWSQFLPAVLYLDVTLTQRCLLPPRWRIAEQGLLPLVIIFLFYNCIVPWGFFLLEIQVAFPGESQLWQSDATLHQTLTWNTGSVTCVQMLMHAVAHRGVRTL